MSAPQIPNLNTFRRGGGRTKLRGRAGPSGGPSTRPFKDTVVQETDNDASGSRLSAVELGYLEDPFISLLFPNGVQTRRFPIINRGGYQVGSDMGGFVDTCVYRNLRADYGDRRASRSVS